MADYFQNTNPWMGAAQLGQGIGNTLSATMLQLPQARAQAALMRQQMMQSQLQMQLAQARGQREETQLPFQTGLLQAQTEEARARGSEAMSHGLSYNTQAGLDIAKTSHQKMQDAAQLDLGVKLGDFAKESLTSGGQISPETAQGLAQALAQLDKVDPNMMPSLQSALAQHISGMNTNPNLAASVLTGAKVEPRMQIQPGATAIDPLNPMRAPYTAPGSPAKENSDSMVQTLINAMGNNVYYGTNRVQNALSDVQSLRQGLARPGLSPAPALINGQAQIRRINSQMEYDSLPSGSTYMDSHGVVGQKK
jgi:hypothetical protein